MFDPTIWYVRNSDKDWFVDHACKAVKPLTMTTCRGAMEENIALFVSHTIAELFDMLGKGEVG